MKGVDLIAINGKTYKPEDAKISVFDRGFLFGDAVYEVTRSYGRILFQLEAHVERLFRSAEQINMDLGISVSGLIDELYRIYKIVNKDDRYLRVQVTRGEGPIGMGSDLAPKRNWIVFVKDVDLVSGDTYEKGTTIVTTERWRNPKQALDPNIKSGNYLNNVLAYQEASKVKATEAVMVDARGFLTEGTTSNVFCVRKGVVQTPPLSSDILHGITRSLIFKIAKKNGISVEEAMLTPSDLRSSDEVFITSSTREVLGVSAVDGQQVKSNGAGPVTKKLATLYKDIIRDYCTEAQSRHPWR